MGVAIAYVYLDKNLAYEEELVAILDRYVQKLRSKEIFFGESVLEWSTKQRGYLGDQVK